MLSQIEQLGKILPLLAIFTALIYWAGKWYKEWYFNEFSSNYEALNYDKLTYLHASWNTILTSTLMLMIANYAYWAVFVFSNWLLIGVAILIVVLSLFILSTRWPFRFDPDKSFGVKLLGAKEFSLQVVGLVALFMTIIAIQNDRQTFSSHLSVIVNYFQSNFLLMAVGTTLVIWVYVGIVGYWLGRYHAQSAIHEGRMGVKWVKIGRSWNLLVTRTSDGRNLVYDVKNRESRFIEDDKILKTKGFNR